MRLPLAGGVPQQVLQTTASAATDFMCPIRPGLMCLVSEWHEGSMIFYGLDPLQGKGSEVDRTRLGPPDDLLWTISPDASRIAISSGDQLHGQVRVLDLHARTERNLQLPSGCFIWSLTWTADNNALLAGVSQTTNYQLVRIDLNGGTTVLLDRGRDYPLSHVRASPDGHHVAFSQLTFESNAWLIENF